MDKKEIPAIDYETGLDIAGRYATLSGAPFSMSNLFWCVMVSGT
jgi:hypothetical protein